MSSASRVIFRSGSSFGFEKILYIDKGLVVVNKPFNFVTQYEDSNPTRPATQLVAGDADPSTPLYPLHRLDKETTGCLAFARSLPSTRSLSQQFQDRSASKIYYALVRGGIDSFNGLTQGLIKDHIAYKNGYGQLCAVNEGRESVTEWMLVGSSSIVPLSLVKLNLHTGNKHQLRIHLAAALKTPILGDQRYSQTDPTEAIKRLLPTSKSPEAPLFLHASRLSFYRYKKTGGSKRFRLGVQAPLPAHFLRLCLKAGIKFDPELVKGGVFLDDVLVEDGRVPQLNGQYLHAS
ncbi:hypothetical protein VKT23_016487 [Stygiomarasmius scandens]|uniref:Pseudouridine synthase RsuA/RluA-like domain-containing protein n=1 Tax=Marasmiellus scandens TaxID=2682957 RepID=A0ABR1IWN2_9AGAR